MADYGKQIWVLMATLIVSALLLASLVTQAGAVSEGNDPDVPSAEKSHLPAEEAQELKEAQAHREDLWQPVKQQVENRVDKDPHGNPIVAGELIVSYDSQVSSTRTANADLEKQTKQKVGAQSKEILPQIDAELLSFAQVKSESSQLLRQNSLERKKLALEHDPNVESVSYNGISKPLAVTHDTSLSYQLNLFACGLNNSLSYPDPNGRFALEGAILVGSVVGLVVAASYAGIFNGPFNVLSTPAEPQPVPLHFGNAGRSPHYLSSQSNNKSGFHSGSYGAVTGGESMLPISGVPGLGVFEGTMGGAPENCACAEG